MINSLEERIEKHREYCSRKIQSEKAAEAIIIHLEPLKEYLNWLSTYEQSSHLELNGKDPETAELEIIPFISSTFNTRWSKEVDEIGVNYMTNFDINKHHHSITVRFLHNKACQIKKIPTGRYIDTYESVSRPEFDIVVQCDE